MLVLLRRRRRARPTRSARSRRSACVACCSPGLTLLPALLTIGGRARLLAAHGGSVAYDPEPEVVPAQRHLAPARRPRAAAARARAWRDGRSVRRRRARPARLQGGLQHHERSSRSRPRASTASRCSSGRSRPARCAPTTVLVERDGRARCDRPTSPRPCGAASRACRRSRPSRPVQRRRGTAQIARLDVVFSGDPYTSSALDVVPKMRDRAATGSRRGVTALVGGGSAGPVRLRQGDRARPRRWSSRSRCS